MDESGFLTVAWNVINRTLFEIGGRPVSVATIILVLTIMLVSVVLSRVAQRAIRRAYDLRGLSDDGNVAVVTYIVHMAFLVVGFGIAIETVGLDLSALFAAGAAFAVAIGLAIQSIIQNFVSGLILLGERTIRPGDVLEVEGKVVKVKKTSMRVTIVRTLDDEDLIVPNAGLVQATVKNYTYSDSLYRLRVPVGVVYSSNMDEVQKTLEKAAQDIRWRNKAKHPVILLTEFGDSSVNFEVSVWLDDPWTLSRRRSELNHVVWKALKAKDIVIAFPQLDVHFDPPVSKGIIQHLSNTKDAA